MADISLVYITAPDISEAERIADVLLSSRLAACVNIYSGVKSLYLWKGERESANETVMMVKTRSSLVPKLADKVREVHSYETPCIIAYPADFASGDYAEWVMRETSDKAASGGDKNAEKP